MVLFSAAASAGGGAAGRRLMGRVVFVSLFGVFELILKLSGTKQMKLPKERRVGRKGSDMD